MYREREREYIAGWGALDVSSPSAQKMHKNQKKKKRSNFHQPHSNVPPTPPTPSKKKTFPEKERMSQIVFQPSFFRGFHSFVGSNHGIKAPTRIQKKNIILITLVRSMPPLHFSVELLQVSAFFQAWIGAWQWSKTHEEKPEAVG